MTRARLPDRRSSHAIDFRFGRMSGVFTVGFSLAPGGGTCAEIFLNVWPSAGDVEKNIRDAAIVASVALQHGAALDELVEAVTHEEDGEASSIIGRALMLVRDAIRDMRGDPGMPEPAAGPASPAGTGGAAADEGLPERRAPDTYCDACGCRHPPTVFCVPAQVRDRLLEPVDPKDEQNDGDPIAAAQALWPLCSSCGWRHAFGQSCTAAAAAAALTRDAMRVEVSRV